MLSPSLRSVLRSPLLVLPVLVDDEPPLLQLEYRHTEEAKEREVRGWFLCLLLSTKEGEDDDEDEEGEESLAEALPILSFFLSFFFFGGKFLLKNEQKKA